MIQGGILPEAAWQERLRSSLDKLAQNKGSKISLSALYDKVAPLEEKRLGAPKRAITQERLVSEMASQIAMGHVVPEYAIEVDGQILASAPSSLELPETYKHPETGQDFQTDPFGKEVKVYYSVPDGP